VQNVNQQHESCMRFMYFASSLTVITNMEQGMCNFIDHKHAYKACINNFLYVKSYKHGDVMKLSTEIEH